MCCEGLIEKFPQLDTCCCCCKVETGSKVIAWAEVVGSIVMIVEAIISIVGVIKDKSSGGIIGVTVVLIIIAVVMCIMALLLLLGLYQEDMGKVKFWLRVSVCLFCTEVVAYIATIISTAVSGMGVAAIVNVVLSAVITTLFQLYMISVVKSHYHNMNNSYDTGRA